MSDNQIQIKQTIQPSAVTYTAAGKKISDTAFSKLFGNAVQSNAAKQSTDMDDIFSRASEKYGVSVNLLKAVAKTESGFDANAVSKCGAQGVMQLMPSTAVSMGIQNPLDAEQNIMGGARYLSQKISQYNGDVKLALAAYNAGSGNVAKYGGVPPFKETQTYVTRVMNYAGMPLDAPEISSLSSLPDSLTSLDSSSALGSLGALSSLTGNSSNLSALSNLLNTVSKSNSEGQTFTYEDYLSFLQLWVKRIKLETTQSLTSSLADLSQESGTSGISSISDLSDLTGLTPESSGLADISGITSNFPNISALAGSSSNNSDLTSSDYKNSTSLLY